MAKRRVVWVRAAGLFFIMVCLVATTSHAKEIRFQGRQVSDKKTGLSLVPVKELSAVAVSSLVHHYFVVLPYTEEWRFESSKDNPLTGSDGRYEVTLVTVTGQLPSPSAYLEGLYAQLTGTPGLTVRDPAFLEERGRPILRYQAQVTAAGALPNVWQWNYWTVASDGAYNIALHLSTMDQTFNPTEQEPRLRILLSSLRADFKPGS